MKILILQDRLRSGGTERQSILLAKGFNAAGHSTTLVTFRPGGALSASAAGLPRETLQPIDLHADWFAPGLRARLRRHNPDIVLCMGRMANCHAGSVQAAVPNAAVVSTMRTGKSLPWLFRRSLQRVSHVVANSDDARRTLQAVYGLPETRVSVIHNSLVFDADAASLASDRTALRQAHGLDEKSVVFVWVGMFRPEKNHQELIEIASQLPLDLPWQLWFVGDGPTRERCEKQARSGPSSSRIRFFGFQADPKPFYRLADVAVLTSRSESLSNFLIEAHAHGLPSVAYRAQGVDECGGRVVPMADRQALLRQMREYLGNEQARRADGATAAAYAREKFSPDRQITRYLDLFTRLCSSAPRA